MSNANTAGFSFISFKGIPLAIDASRSPIDSVSIEAREVCRAELIEGPNTMPTVELHQHVAYDLRINLTILAHEIPEDLIADSVEDIIEEGSPMFLRVEAFADLDEDAVDEEAETSDEDDEDEADKVYLADKFVLFFPNVDPDPNDVNIIFSEPLSESGAIEEIANKSEKNQILFTMIDDMVEDLEIIGRATPTTPNDPMITPPVTLDLSGPSSTAIRQSINDGINDAQTRHARELEAAKQRFARHSKTFKSYCTSFVPSFVKYAKDNGRYIPVTESLANNAAKKLGEKLSSVMITGSLELGE